MRVLVVDDNKEGRLLLSKLLTSNNYEVKEACNGLEALESLEVSKPDIIISDILMPEMDGFTLIRELNKDISGGKIPVVFYSAQYVNEKDKELAKKLGASRFIIKPTEPKDILRDVEVSSSAIIEDGRIAGSRDILRDITERKKTEEKIEASLKEKEILLREIHHRVKNNLQIISSLLGLAAGTIREKKYVDMFRESQNRINSMSLIHEKLYQSRDLAKIGLNEYIRDLANVIFQSHGVIDKNTFELIVRDNGVGLPYDMDFRKTESLGLRLIILLVENQLKGKIDMDRSKGIEFIIKFQEGNNGKE